jgi:hypothetical protein
VPTVIVHVTLETTSPSAAVASLGCVGDGDGEADVLPVGDGLPADGVAPAEADAAGVPVGDAAPEGTVADADGDAEGAVGGALALGVGLGLPDEGMQRMSRMQVWLGVGCVACAAADA